MNGFQVKEILDRLGEMDNRMKKMCDDLREYHGKMKGLIDRLEDEGLPREFISRFRNDHLEKISRYFDGLSKHLADEAIPYTKKVIKKTDELLSQIGN